MPMGVTSAPLCCGAQGMCGSQVLYNGNWLEVLGCGMIKVSVAVSALCSILL